MGMSKNDWQQAGAVLAIVVITVAGVWAYRQFADRLTAEDRRLIADIEAFDKEREVYFDTLEGFIAGCSAGEFKRYYGEQTPAIEAKDKEIFDRVDAADFGKLPKATQRLIIDLADTEARFERLVDRITAECPHTLEAE